jgi:hypothetical protein
MRHDRNPDERSEIRSGVALGHGVAVVPETVKTISVANVVFRDIAADRVPHTSIAFVYGSDPSPSAKLLIRHMQHHALRNGGKGAAPPHNRDRIIIPSALVIRHPEVRAKGAPRRMRPVRLGRRPSRLASLAPQGDGMSR